MRKIYNRILYDWKLILLSISIGISIIMTSYISFRLYSQFKENIINQNLILMNNIALSAARSLDRYLDEHIAQIQILSKNVRFINSFIYENIDAGPGGENSLFNNFLGIISQDLTALYALGSDSSIIKKYPQGPEPDYIESADTTGIPAQNKFSRPEIKAVTGAPDKKFLISITVPFAGGGKNTTALKWVIKPEGIYNDYFKQNNFKDLTVWLIDNNGKIISHPFSSFIGLDFLKIRGDENSGSEIYNMEDLLNDIMNGNSGGGYLNFNRNSGSQSQLLAYAPVHVSDKLWSVAVTKNYSLISGPIERYAGNFLFTSLLIIFFILLFGFIYYRSQKIKAVLKAEKNNLDMIKKTSTALMISESRLKTTFKNASIATTVIGLDGGFLEVNDAMCGLVGYTEQELLDMTFMEITNRNDIEENTLLINSLLNGKLDSFRLEKRYIHKSGRSIWVDLFVSLIRDEAGNPLNFIVQIQDISGRKESEEKIRISLKEKDIMLQEIHHRVKNNMQIISSLLSLQCDVIEDDAMQQIMVNCQNRIRSMALVHEMLYKSKNLSEINFNDYIRTIVKELSSSYHMPGKNIAISLDSDNISIDINFAIPCALIVNELVSNSLKHAFPDRTEGEIRISFRRENKDFLLTISDNGIGFKHNLNYIESGSLGLYLVIELCSQINGTIQTEENNGTVFSIRFGKAEKTDKGYNFNYLDQKGEKGRRNKILIVEDERITAIHLRKMLENAGYHITAIASSGNDAIRSILMEKPDLIIMDIFLEGEKNGIEAVKELRRYFDIPVIYSSANTDEYIRQKAEETSPVGFLSKPVDKYELIDLVRTTLTDYNDSEIKKSG